MAYLSKESVLAAYQHLSTLSADPQSQGATQRVSAIRYSLALNMFYKQFGRECNVKDRDDAAAYIENVGKVVSVDGSIYTSNFHFPLSNNADYSVGSNFYSVNVVRESTTNGGQRLIFPRRGSNPIMFVQSGKLYEDSKLFENIGAYIHESSHKAALVLWILRNVTLDESDIYTSAKNELNKILTTAYIEKILPKKTDFENYCQIIKVSFHSSKAVLTTEDIENLFKPTIIWQRPENQPATQTIYYGCPGTGKSFEVKMISEGKNGDKIIWYNKPTLTDKSCTCFEGIPTDDEKKNLTNNIFRTTFHPDYDYATFVGCYKPVKEGAAIDYKFIPQVFTNAYVCAYRHREDPIYLIIEEINRGNCAQIFGDLFQLLDRTNGESDYAIKPDTELAKYLASQGVPSEELKLPDNLHIYATMNTSDQSLFPMDSAFKRRWAMEYMPINYTQKKASTFTIEVAGKKYPWIKFLEMVNERIVNATDSEDKQMGEFFIKGDVDEREFKNKVMFYLWNDVCKDLYNPRHVQGAFFLRVKNKLETEKNDYFTFAELFSDRNENSRLLIEFFSYLESKYQEVKPEFTFGPIE